MIHILALQLQTTEFLIGYLASKTQCIKCILKKYKFTVSVLMSEIDLNGKLICFLMTVLKDNAQRLKVWGRILNHGEHYDLVWKSLLRICQ